MAKVLIVRLGAMGDILHALPAVAALRQAHPDWEFTWIVEPKWTPLLAGSSLVHHILPMQRRDALSVWTAYRWLRRWKADLALDFQGLIKSGLVAWLSGAAERLGFANDLREEAAGVFYTRRKECTESHVVDRNCCLVGLEAATAPLPAGIPEGELPAEDFVLAAPFAGWASKQWPIENYAALGKLLKDKQGVDLVLNVAPGQETPAGMKRHESSLAGLIDATRKATGVLGLDSGPLHLAAALGKKGLALFGPTDPERNGPYGGSIRVLRDSQAVTTYKRESEISASMRALRVELVHAALVEAMR